MEATPQGPCRPVYYYRRSLLGGGGNGGPTRDVRWIRGAAPGCCVGGTRFVVMIEKRTHNFLACMITVEAFKWTHSRCSHHSFSVSSNVGWRKCQSNMVVFAAIPRVGAPVLSGIPSLPGWLGSLAHPRLKVHNFANPKQRPERLRSSFSLQLARQFIRAFVLFSIRSCYYKAHVCA